MVCAAPFTHTHLLTHPTDSFEEAVLMRTPCQVHTFDCTYEKGASIHERHFFHKVRAL